MSKTEPQDTLGGVAIVGMAGRFPGARNLEEFWRNLRAGVEAITFFSDEEVLAAGVSPATLRNPNYVKAAGVLDDIESFDAPFFNFTPREAEVTDPQQRLFLECAWEALENAGHTGESLGGSVGVYAGASISGYLFQLYARRELLDSIGAFRTLLGNDKDFLPMWVSYKLNLTGPSVNVQTACSTSLVAVHLACQSLLNYECDMALAGGVTVAVPHRSGYLYQPGGIHSPDGHSRAFDREAQGVVGGSGVGVVVLKRLSDALEDRDFIHAVVRGSAVNNDGALKVGFTAPSVQGQAEVIKLAQAVARVKAEQVTYVEAHGSATPIGDPIEITALAKAFGRAPGQPKVCAVGSVKTNIGHAGAAAGVAGLLKTVLALKHRTIPPSLHFSQPNPQIDFDNSPFYVNSAPVEWEADRGPCVAGVSSFGIGGTNAHVIVEEAAPPPSVASARPWQVLVLSAGTEAALERATDNLAAYFEQNPSANLADVAYTLQVGRKVFDHRRALVCRDVNDALQALRTRDPRRILSGVKEKEHRPVVFMLSGLGDHYADMGWQLYRTEPVFREQLDHCARLLMPILREDIRAALYPGKDLTQRAASDAAPIDEPPSQSLNLRQMLRREGPAGEDAAAQSLSRTTLAQPALFSVVYVLAQLWMSFGVRPQGLIGYSLGEYVAACLSGVLSLEDALTLVARRAQMIEELGAGAMLAVPLAEADVLPLLGSELSLSAVNGPELCVVAGPEPAVAALEQQLLARGLACRRVQTSHAFHSQMMRPVAPQLTRLVAGFALRPPQIPYVSNVTGTWITDAEATAPDYWERHLCQPVRFADGVGQLTRQPGHAWLEVGPGQTLCSFVRQHPRLDRSAAQVLLPTLPQSYDRQPETAFMLNTLAQLWLTDVDVDWFKFHGHESRRRVPLPTYPFERQRYWIGTTEAEPESAHAFGLGADEAWEDSGVPAQAAAGDVQRADGADGRARQLSTALYARPHLRTAYVAPVTPLERQVTAVWQELLGIQPIGIHDRFLDLGGQSLLATQLVSRLREIFHPGLSLRALFDAPTVAQLAALIESERQAQADNAAAPGRELTPRPEVRREAALIKIQSQGSKPPFVCVHPVGGGVFCYTELARCLGSDQPFYAMQAPALGGGEALTGVPEMAAHYCAELLKAQPRGPFYLGGWSFGGEIAFEMAQQLRERGHEVALLALLDSYTPLHASQTQSELNDERLLLARFILDIARSNTQSPAAPLAQLEKTYEEFHRLELGDEDRLRYAWEQGRQLGLLPNGSDLQQFRLLYEVFKQGVRAELTYEPRAYEGSVVLFMAEDEDELRRPDRALGWRRFAAGPFRVVPVPGDHYTMLTAPRVQGLAAALQGRLAGVGEPDAGFDALVEERGESS